MKRFFYLGIILLGITAIAGCSRKEGQQSSAQLKPTDPTTGIREADFVWGKEVIGNVTLFYQPTDSLKRIAPAMKDRVSKVYQRISDYLRYAQPEPIEFYCYQDTAALMKYTGRDTTFFLGNRFYYGYGPSYGREMAEFVVSKLPGGPSRFAFVRDGILFLLDFSGRNYHHATNNFLQEKTLLPAQVLVDDERYNKEQGLQKSVEAASLCAYIMYDYGYDKFMEVYHSKDDFPTTLKNVLGIDMNKLEKDWEAFLPEHTNEKEMEREKAAAEGRS